MNIAAHIGALGERAATKYLRKSGFLIRELNWRNGRYEIDIIAEKWGVIHFIEVKTRKIGGWTTPEQALTAQKETSIKRAAAAYLAFNAIRQEFQFGLIAIDVQGDDIHEIRYYENAIQSKL